MCRLFGAAASVPVDISFELLASDNPLVRQSERHDSGWGMAAYRNGLPEVVRFPHAAHVDPDFREAASATSRLFVVHVRRATVGGLTPENTHPFSSGRYVYCHNGTILAPERLSALVDSAPAGDTDSERFFALLLASIDVDDMVGSLRRVVEAVCDRCQFSALNFLICDGRLLYAYRLGLFRLYWLARCIDLDANIETGYHLHVGRACDEHMVMVSSEKLTADEPWSKLGQDQLLVCDPADPDHPRIEHLLGARVGSIEFVPVDDGDHLTGAARGEWAERRAAAGT